jgi:type IV secretory pathway VirD2 relaxase
MNDSKNDRLLSFSKLARAASGETPSVMKPSRLMRPIETDRLEGRLSGGAGRTNSAGGRSSSASTLSRRMAQKAPIIRHTKPAGPGDAFSDSRQRATVKVHYFNHVGGGAGALKAHARYLARDAESRDDVSGSAGSPALETTLEAPEASARAHADYLARGECHRGVFYDREAEGIDGGALAEAWAKSDKRHFRIILAPEEGERLRDLTSYTREVMAQAEVELGTRFSWVAVNHYDTGHAHTHIILRGRRANGQDLILPRDFIRHRLREIARDVATSWLDRRTPSQERKALAREATRHAPTRLDKLIAAQLPESQTIEIGRLNALGRDPHVTAALRARTKELNRLGLAREVRKGVVKFEPGWQDRLKAMELHLDIRKQLMAERQILQQVEHERLAHRVQRNGLTR